MSTKTTYFEIGTDKKITQDEFFTRYYKGDKTVDSKTECLECGKTLEVHEICDCEADWNK